MNKPDLNFALALQLKLLRTGAGLSQDELAARLGVHRNSVYNWERGMGLQTSLFVKLCKELDADAGQVLKQILE